MSGGQGGGRSVRRGPACSIATGGGLRKDGGHPNGCPAGVAARSFGRRAGDPGNEAVKKLPVYLRDQAVCRFTPGCDKSPGIGWSICYRQHCAWPSSETVAARGERLERLCCRGRYGNGIWPTNCWPREKPSRRPNRPPGTDRPDARGRLSRLPDSQRDSSHSAAPRRPCRLPRWQPFSKRQKRP